MNPANFLRETIDLVKQIETRFIELASRLYKIKEQELWKEGYGSFHEFVLTAKINPGHASILTSIYKMYVIEHGISEDHLLGAGYSNLYEAIPLIEKDGVENALIKAKTLTRQELKQQKVFELTGEECSHAALIQICATCHKRI